MSDESIQAEVARLKESLVPLLKRAVTKIAQKACRNGENETREWPPLAELPYLESWVVVGEKYGEAVFGVLHATLHNTIVKHVEQFEKKFKEYELAVNENVELIARLDKLEEEKDELIDKLEKENATLRKRAEVAEERILHSQAYNEKQMSELRATNRKLLDECKDAEKAKYLLGLHRDSAMADLDTLTKALNNQDEKLRLYERAEYSEELAVKMPAILASAEAGGWRKDLIGFPDFLINWLATKLPDLTTVANLKKSVRIQKEEIDAFKVLIEGKDSQIAQCKARLEAHKEVLEKENKKLSETARKYVDVTALAMRYGFDPVAVDLSMFLIGRMEEHKTQSEKVADLRTKLEERTRSLNALNVKVSTLEATASEHGWNGSDTLPFFFSNRMADLKACRAELTNLKAKLEETNRLHTAHKEHYEEVVRVAKQHGYNGNDFVHQFLNQKLLQLLGRLSGLESLALKFGWVRDDKGPFEFFERALRSPYETLTPYRQLGYRFHWDDNEEELLDFLEKKLRANIEMSNTATFSVDAVKSLHKGLNRIDTEDMGRVYKNYSDYTYDQFKMASKDWLSFLAWPGHESYAGAILRLAEMKASGVLRLAEKKAGT